MGILSTIFGGSGKKAAAATQQAANVAAQAQQQGMGIMQQEADLMNQYRQPALAGLSQYFMQPQDQAAMIEEARMSPLYQAIMGTRRGGEDAIARNASMTGGLRSGNTNAAMYDFNTQLENKALLDSYNAQLGERDFRVSGMAGLAGLPSYAPQLAEMTSGIGMTQAQGIQGAAQAREIAGQNRSNNILGLAGSALKFFSDIRLKENIKHAGVRNGWQWYEWDWIHEAQDKLGLPEKGEGVLAHHVYEKCPEAIGTDRGFLTVDYDKLGLEVH